MLKNIPKFVNGNTLKLIAIISMILDHVAVCLIPTIAAVAEEGSFLSNSSVVFTIIDTQRAFGRLAFPLFLFLLLEGLEHTKDIKKYAARLLVFALISEIPFDYAVYGEIFHWGKQNVMFTLFLSLITIAGIDNVLTIFSEDKTKRVMLSLSIMMFSVFAAYFIKCDYGYIGVGAAIAMYFFKSDKIKSIFAGSIILMLGFSSEITAIFSVIPVLFYNGKRGSDSKILKYAFYVFYPLHLLIIIGIKSLF
ncbi:MAG: conjugal transfer protein TraX [Lachnospiraceae bacterium]|nr:conjugal transfer protein TraX [Lachnospiraceae bacterium]